ncbi:MAG TPA: Rieske 2Fe-2S domain-containing protein [Candidatus Binatia bacterium]|jgi:cytochrome b6-f complex iron-sulfur subunit|nr:Rieske 2Fe-2S domain-containing protein [Candidatus Binatia bacterium]
MAKEKAATAEELNALAERRRQEQSAERQKREREKAQRAGLWSRRDFFGRLSWGGFGVVSLISLLAFVRSAFPRILFVPPTTFKAGLPADYPVGEVSEKYKTEFRVWIIREPLGFYAIFAKCTHLGCTPRWLASENKYKCPCHGSGYYKTGYNFEGPAPRPMDRVKIALGEDGQLVVDKSVLFRMQPGVDPNKQHPESILKV